MRFNTLLFALVALFFVACKGKIDTNTSSSTAANSNTAAAPAPAAPKEVPLPASLSKFKPLTLPFKLEKGMQEGDLDQLGWAVGTKMYFKTPEQVYATLACTNIAEDFTDISFELQAYTPEGQPAGKAETLTYFSAMASSGATHVSDCAISIDASGKLTLSCEDSTDGSDEDGNTVDEKSQRTNTYVVAADGVRETK